MNAVTIKKNPHPGEVSLQLPASKSESNRALILEALAGESGKIRNLSTARDTHTLDRLLRTGEKMLDVLDAGTTMRFLTAYMTVTGQQKIITGTRRMCERPIGILVDALREVGGDITYTSNPGYPPLETKGFRKGGKSTIEMRGDVSSQFISAMLMIAAKLEHGLTINLSGKIGSRPYIEMTLRMMEHYGIRSDWSGSRIHVPRQEFRAAGYSVDPDWSGASYWYAVAAMADEADIMLEGFHEASLQGDRKITEIMDLLGVQTEFSNTGIHLRKKSAFREIAFDFSDCPDLAQTVIVTCAGLGIRAHFSGIESLRIKETDRISALQAELKKIGAGLVVESPDRWVLHPADPLKRPDHVSFETYGDHRMAMALAPLATCMDITITDPEVVNKSYPEFWDHMGAMFECIFS